MSLSEHLSVQHLSDEAVTAYADGMLGNGPAARAGRHVAQCPGCAQAIAEQQAASQALRAAVEPALPAGLLERLRAVPSTTSLTPSTMSLAPDGSAVFPAYGTRVPSARPADTASMDRAVHIEPAGALSGSRFPVAVPHRIGRRTQQLALATAAAAMVTMGMAASAAASTSSQSTSPHLGPTNGPSISTVQHVVNPVPSQRPLLLVGAVTATSGR
jgi:anti-sigma factor RsiW